MPDAHLMGPVAPSHLAANIVEVPPGVISAERLFLIVFALLFGFRASVNNFTRFSVFFQSVGRRIAALLTSLFYDDASLQDLACARGRGQLLMVTLRMAWPSSKNNTNLSYLYSVRLFFAVPYSEPP